MTRMDIIGSGFVGERVGRGLVSSSRNVIFYDVVDKNLPNFTRDINYSVENSDISFICTPTPTTNEGIDLGYVKKDCEKYRDCISLTSEVSCRSDKKHSGSNHD